MNTLQNAQRKRKVLLGLALLVILIGGGFIYAGYHNFPIRAVGLAIVMGGAYLVQVANAQLRSIPSVPENRNSPNTMRRALWIGSVSLLPLLAGSLILFALDAANGGHVAWPADLLAGVVLVCAIVWGLLVASVFSGRRRT